MKIINLVLSNKTIFNKYRILNVKKSILIHNNKIFKAKEIYLVVNRQMKLKLNRKEYSYENIYYYIKLLYITII